MVFYFLKKYAHEATCVYGKILDIDLADFGTLQTSRLAHDFLIWHFGYEELVIDSIDLDNVGRAPLLDFEARPNMTSSNTSANVCTIINTTSA